MRNPGVEYVHLFRVLPLVPIETSEEYEEATRRLEWIDGRNGLGKSAADYRYVLQLLVGDYLIRQANKPTLAEIIEYIGERDVSLSYPTKAELDAVDGEFPGRDPAQADGSPWPSSPERLLDSDPAPESPAPKKRGRPKKEA